MVIARRRSRCFAFPGTASRHCAADSPSAEAGVAMVEPRHFRRAFLTTGPATGPEAAPTEKQLTTTIVLFLLNEPACQCIVTPKLGRHLP
jgi:hypothetical protein